MKFISSVAFIAPLAALAIACSSSGDDDDMNTPGGTGGAIAPAGTGGATLAGTGGKAVVLPSGTGGIGGTGGVPAGGGGSGGGVPVDGGGGAGGSGPVLPMGKWTDPGPNPWTLVPEAQVAAECKMDIALLKATGITQSFAVFRYGKLCYEEGSDFASDVFSVTKTVSGTIVGAAQYEVRDNPVTGKGTGQFKPSDFAADWGDRAGPDMRISHLASMVAGSASLDWGSKTFSYDTFGTNLARVGAIASVALAQGSESDLTLAGVRDKVFDKLGMDTASWTMGSYGTGASLTLHDMGKLFTLLIHGGVYNDERLIGQDWVYWMTHPPWEDANTSYGMFMWLAHKGGATGIGGDFSTMGQGDPAGDPCSPGAFWKRYPHPPSEATDCMATGGGCEQMFDVGVFSAQGLNGQFIVGHRGLDLVLAVKDYSNGGGPPGLWEKIRPALVALDPMFMGDEAAFCAAYGAGNYAPDLKVPLEQPADP